MRFSLSPTSSSNWLRKKDKIFPYLLVHQESDNHNALYKHVSYSIGAKNEIIFNEVKQIISSLGHLLSFMYAINWPCNRFSWCFLGLSFLPNEQKKRQTCVPWELRMRITMIQGKHCGNLEINSAFLAHSVYLYLKTKRS